jgi:hypothetical protein
MISFEKYFFLIFVTFLSGCNLSPGSYPYAEKYEINSKEQDVIKAIETFKNIYPQYKTPEEIGLVDSRGKEHDHWYHIYFYYPEENQIVYAWTRPIDGKRTTLALISVNEGLTLGNWKDINHDFKKSDNEKQKAIFENRIFNPIRLLLE